MMGFNLISWQGPLHRALHLWVSPSAWRGAGPRGQDLGFTYKMARTCPDDNPGPVSLTTHIAAPCYDCRELGCSVTTLRKALA